MGSGGISGVRGRTGGVRAGDGGGADDVRAGAGVEGPPGGKDLRTVLARDEGAAVAVAQARGAHGVRARGGFGGDGGKGAEQALDAAELSGEEKQQHGLEHGAEARACMCSPRRGGAVEDSEFVCQFGCCEGHGERMPPMEGPRQGFFFVLFQFLLVSGALPWFGRECHTPG